MSKNIVRTLMSELDSGIIGNEEAKRAVAFAVSLHLLNSGKDDYPKRKPNTILYGPTGSGKTELLRVVSNILEIPLVTIDCSSLSFAGAKGDSIVIQLQNRLSQYSPKEAARAVVLLDEVDKLCLETAQDTNMKIQSELLCVISGVEIVLNKIDAIKTDHMLFFAAGAFSGMIEDTSVLKVMGIGASEAKVSKSVSDQELIIKAGLMPELVGRFVSVRKTQRPDPKDLVSIIKNIYIPEAIESVQELLDSVGVIPRFCDTYALELVEDKSVMDLGIRRVKGKILDDLQKSVFVVKPGDFYEITYSGETKNKDNSSKTGNVQNIGGRFSFLSKSISEVRDFKKGEVVLKSGESNRFVFVLLEGSVQVGSGKTKKIIDEKYASFGDISALSGGLVTVTITCNEKCKFAIADARDIKKDCSDIEVLEIAQNALKKIS